MMKLIYWLFTLLRIPKDTIEDEYEVCIDYIKGYGWLKPNTEIPGNKIPKRERTPERLKWMEENNIRLEPLPGPSTVFILPSVPSFREGQKPVERETDKSYTL